EEQLVEAMLGQRQLRRTNEVPNAEPGHPVVVAREVSLGDDRGSIRFRNASFEVHSGEMIGVAAVEGSGHRELLRALAGRLPISDGTLTLPAAVGFVPSDRHRDGLVLRMSLSENYALKGAGQRRGVVPWGEVA